MVGDRDNDAGRRAPEPGLGRLMFAPPGEAIQGATPSLGSYTPVQATEGPISFLEEPR